MMTPAPCPFCGCRMMVSSNRVWHHLTGDHAETCPFDPLGPIISAVSHEGLRKMIASWNIRSDADNTSAKIAVMAEKLRKIEKWFGEFPPTKLEWPDGSPMSYAAAFGSNGERDFMRGVAREGLQDLPERAQRLQAVVEAAVVRDRILRTKASFIKDEFYVSLGNAEIRLDEAVRAYQGDSDG